MTDHIIIKRAETSDEKEQIKVLWEEIFGDDRQYVENFYKVFPMRENAFVALDGQALVGMVNSIDCKAKLQDKSFNGKYVYALAVKKQYRGKGIAKKLLNMCESEVFTMLIPERDELFAMYEHLGYTVKTAADIRFTEPHKIVLNSGRTVSALVKSENTEIEKAIFSI